MLQTFVPSPSNASGAAGGVGFITANTTYYVRTDGSDSNSGSANTPGGAFRTVQNAINTIGNLSINSGVTVTIQLGDGTYVENLRLLSIAGGGGVTINGNSASPGNVIIAPSSGDAISGSQPLAKWLLQNFTITAAGGNAIATSLGATIVVGTGIIFGAAKSGGYHMLANNNSCIIISGNYSVTGGTGNHLYATRGSAINNSQSFAISISNSPTFTAFTAADDNGVVAIFGMTFSGTTVGKKFDVNLNGVVHTLGAGANYFPGTTPGTTANGGQYQ